METPSDDYDVIIIGAGPAGLSCAARLSGNNLKVLILEQKDTIGPKVCAGGLTRKGLIQFEIPEKILDCSFKKISLHTPLFGIEKEDAAVMIATIDRKMLADWQLDKLKNAKNVTIMTGCKVTEISKDSVSVNGSSHFRYKHLVGADGSFSSVRRYLGIKTEQIAIAIQYIIPTEKYEKLEIFFDSRLFAAWYAWIFPHKGYVSIGCMCDTRHLSAKKLQANFHKWLQEKDIDVSDGTYQGYAINYDYRGYRFDNIFLAGDAAGFASGPTGEGIYPALVSGTAVAKTIMNANYEAKEIAELLQTKKIQNKAMDVIIKMGPLQNAFFILLVQALRNRRVASRIVRSVL